MSRKLMERGAVLGQMEERRRRRQDSADDYEGASGITRQSPLYGLSADLQRDLGIVKRRTTPARVQPRKQVGKAHVTTTTRNKLVVAAIDFGTTYSGYAFSFKHEYDTDPMKMHANEWRNVAAGNMNAKIPTCLLLEPNKSLHSFGHQAKTKYASLCEDKKHQAWYFFWEFKMSLHQEKEIKGNYQLTEENGKKLDALTVFSLSIKALKGHLMTVLQNGYKGVRDSDVAWIVTVPAIWNDSAKKFMRLAAEKAGIQKESIEIALEPEAASIYCRLLPITRDPQTADGLTKFPSGTRYMILDCGGGTVDVTVHEVLADNNLKELYKATGGNWGGTVVNKAFLNFMSKLVGQDVFNDFSKTNKAEYLELLDEFENKKRMTAADSTEKVTVRIPIGLQEMFQHDHVQQALERNYRNKVDVYRDKLRMDAALFRWFFEQAVGDIIAHTHDLMESLPRPVKAILMVGGFSESLVLQDAVKKAFQHRVDVIIPVEASLCIMKGAVLYGHRPSRISERKCRYTYGVAMTVPFVSGKYETPRKVVSDGQEWCDNVFDKHVEIGQTVIMGEAQATRTYYPMSTSDRFLPIIIYRSTDTNPTYVDEKSCEFVEYFHVKREPGSGETEKKDAIKVRMIFGSSDIKVETMKADGSIHDAEFSLD